MTPAYYKETFLGKRPTRFVATLPGPVKLASGTATMHLAEARRAWLAMKGHFFAKYDAGDAPFPSRGQDFFNGFTPARPSPR
jgi:hypothetical protein